jgi:endonuclease III related protein
VLNKKAVGQASQGRMNLRNVLLEIYEKMDRHFGDLKWWPADGPFEVIVGAILTQNAAWTNVEKAIVALKKKNLLNPKGMLNISDECLASLIRPSGYYHLKTLRLKTFVRFLTENYSGNVEIMQQEELWTLRERLLGVWGIGRETADSILLYACEKPIFVVDAYTKRILHRHGLIDRNLAYEGIQRLFMQNLPHDRSLFNQYHALLVNTGKYFCRKNPDCAGCPLGGLFGDSPKTNTFKMIKNERFSQRS